MRNIFSLLLIFSAFPGYASWSDIKSKEFTSVNEGFPSADSESEALRDQYQSEVGRLFDEKELRTKGDCALSRLQRFPGFENMFAYKAPASGTYEAANVLSDAEAEQVGEFVERVMAFTERVAGYYKNKFARVRPFNAHPDLIQEDCAFKPTGATSFPSSHSAMAYVGGYVLAYIYADRKDDFQNHAEMLANLRIRVGVHYPSDVEAGETLAKEIWTRLKKEKDFMKEIKALKKDTRSACSTIIQPRASSATVAMRS